MTKMDEKTVKKLHKVVLTGGPCGGKTTGQARLCTFFECIGWQVYRVPETASVLLSGGVKFNELGEERACKFQENLLKSMLQIENTFFDLGATCSRNCLIICDRGAMDVSSYISPEKWEHILSTNNFNVVELRDDRYNQIVHMVSAANGAEEFYTLEDGCWKAHHVACSDASVALTQICQSPLAGYVVSAFFIMMMFVFNLLVEFQTMF